MLRDMWQTKSCFAFFFFFFLVDCQYEYSPDSPFVLEYFPVKNLLEACKEESNYFLYGRGYVGLQLHSFNQGLSPALLPLSLDALGVVISDRRLDADTHLHFCARTDFLLSDTFRPCSGILFINLSALVGDLESVSSHKDVVIKIN